MSKNLTGLIGLDTHQAIDVARLGGATGGVHKPCTVQDTS